MQNPCATTSLKPGGRDVNIAKYLSQMNIGHRGTKTIFFAIARDNSPVQPLIMGRQYFVFLFRRGTEQPRQGDMNNSTSPNMFPIHKKSDQTRSGTTILQLLLCTAYKIKMVGDDYPFMLQCLVYRKKGTVTVHHWGILTHP